MQTLLLGVLLALFVGERAFFYLWAQPSKPQPREKSAPEPVPPQQRPAPSPDKHKKETGSDLHNLDRYPTV